MNYFQRLSVGELVTDISIAKEKESMENNLYLMWLISLWSDAAILNISAPQKLYIHKSLLVI